MATITKKESARRRRENARLYPLGLIDEHNDQRRPCECCKEDRTRGACFEDDDGAHVCNRCY